MASFLFASDSLKGTLGSEDTARILSEAARRHFPGCTVRSVPMADGGEGTAAALVAACGGRMRAADVHDPLGRPVRARYGILGSGRAVIEMAAAAGLTLLSPDERDPEETGTYGVGELVRAALDDGARSLTLTLGGSATNDGGMGCMRALGVRFLDGGGRELEGRGRDLADVREVDLRGIDRRLAEAPVTVMCDVDNPLLGPDGATRTFAPQKGAGPEAVERLERGMANYADVVGRAVGRELDVPGAGAAGGMGACAVAFMGGQVQSGIGHVLDLVGFDGLLLGGADLVVTGEGRLDAQTAHGKVVSGVGAACARRGVPCVAVVGSIAPGTPLPHGVDAAFPTASGPMTLDYALGHADGLYRATAERLFRTLALGARLHGGVARG